MSKIVEKTNHKTDQEYDSEKIIDKKYQNTIEM